MKHCGAGRSSNHAKQEKFHKQVLRLVGYKYSSGIGERFGPTLAAEHLAVRIDLIDAETLRRRMLSAGLWSRERKRGPYCKRRERKGHFGELSNRR